MVSQSAGALFSQNPAREYPVQEIRPGQYAVPVKLEIGHAISNEPNQRDYELPQIINQYKQNNNNGNNNSNTLFPDNILMAEIDINKISTQVKQAKTNKDKIKILRKGSKTLEKEASTLSTQIQSDVANLVNAKAYFVMLL